jgi:hypothetical protein
MTQDSVLQRLQILASNLLELLDRATLQSIQNP